MRVGCRVCVLAVFIGLVLVCCGVFPVFAAGGWVQNVRKGDWAVCESGYWKANAGQYSGEALWTYNESLSNFVGYYANIMIVDIDAWVTSWYPWDSSAGKEFQVWHEFQGSNTNIKVGIHVEAICDFWGLTGKRRVYGIVLVNSTEYKFVWSWQSGLGVQNVVEIWVTKVDDSRVNVKIYHYPSLLDKPALLKDETINVGSQWFSSVTLKRYVWHNQWGGWTSRNNGKFEAYIVNENFTFTPTEFPEPKSQGENIWDTFMRGFINLLKPIPEWIRNTLTMLYDSLKFVVSIFGLIFTWALNLLPLLLPMLILWFLSAAVDSADQGSISPLAEMIYRIVDFTRAVIQTIANVLHAIWDILTFWS